MTKFDDFKNSSKTKIEELRAEYEALRIEAQKAENERKEELQEHLDRVDRLKNELEDKYKRIEHFGEIAVEELSDAFFTSAEAFSDSMKRTKDRLK